jgi:hypothetical protein
MRGRNARREGHALSIEERARAVIDASPAYIVFVVICNLRLLAATLGYVLVVLKRFFMDQHWAKLFPGDVPVRNIEHRLDASIPVRYETVGVYLKFIKLWISALSYFRRHIGRAFDADVADFLRGLSRCYIDASAVYGRCRTTTRRPSGPPNKRLAFVYSVDPHLFCIPSLHVLVVCYTYRRLDELLSARGLRGEFSVELDALRERARRITESILYVRQHSVNCIPTALAMISLIVETYDEAEAKSFLSTLFVDDDRVAEPDKAAITEYMVSLYHRLAKAGDAPETRYAAIADFILGYEELRFDSEEPALGPDGLAGA